MGRDSQGCVFDLGQLDCLKDWGLIGLVSAQIHLIKDQIHIFTSVLSIGHRI
jgi:hypothetical protein